MTRTPASTCTGSSPRSPAPAHGKSHSTPQPPRPLCPTSTRHRQTPARRIDISCCSSSNRLPLPSRPPLRASARTTERCSTSRLLLKLRIWESRWLLIGFWLAIKRSRNIVKCVCMYICDTGAIASASRLYIRHSGLSLLVGSIQKTLIPTSTRSDTLSFCKTRNICFEWFISQQISSSCFCIEF